MNYLRLTKNTVRSISIGQLCHRVHLHIKKHCASLFIDFSKAFDTVDHEVLLQRLANIGLSNSAVGWFSNYLSDRTQCVKIDDCSSDTLTVHKGVPQGSILGPLLFTIYINDLGKYVQNANAHFYADDTIIYCFGESVLMAVEHLQAAFKEMEAQLLSLRLVLNVDKTKMMIFTKSRDTTNCWPTLFTAQGTLIETVTTYKYLGIILDKNVSFKPHIENLTKKLKVRLGFYFRHKSCFSFVSKKRLIAATFIPLLDYGDVLYMNACSTSLHMLDASYHCALRFITGYKSLTHHCTLYSKVGWLSLSARRLLHWCTFIYKDITGLLPSYLCTYLTFKSDSSYSLRSLDFLSTSVPRTCTEFGKRAFMYSAPSAWNTVQKTLKLQELITMNDFKTRITCFLMANFGVCKCFTV